MTNEEIDAMVAGRELDALVAKLIMGANYPRLSREEIESFGYQDFYDENGWNVNIGEYSTDISAAWKVVGHFIAAGCAAWVEGDGHTGWIVGVTSEKGRFESFSDAAPLAICRAALKAVSV